MAWPQRSSSPPLTIPLYYFKESTGLWVREGATPWQTLQAATKHGAEVCGVGKDLGTVEVGKLADLIVVGANPLDDINNVRRLQLVFKEGRLVSDKRSERRA